MGTYAPLASYTYAAQGYIPPITTNVYAFSKLFPYFLRKKYLYVALIIS